MKIRKGFVSNSSSSSFVCEICGREESGYDMNLSEAEMIRCQNDHIICLSHINISKMDKDVLIKVILKRSKKHIDDLMKNSIEELWDIYCFDK